MAYSSMKVKDLNLLLDGRGLAKTGNKKDKVARLSQADVEEEAKASQMSGDVESEASEGTGEAAPTEQTEAVETTEPTEPTISTETTETADVAETAEPAEATDPEANEPQAEDAESPKENGVSATDESKSSKDSARTTGRKRKFADYVPDPPTEFFIKISPVSSELTEDQLKEAFNEIGELSSVAFYRYESSPPAVVAETTDDAEAAENTDSKESNEEDAEMTDAAKETEAIKETEPTAADENEKPTNEISADSDDAPKVEADVSEENGAPKEAKTEAVEAKAVPLVKPRVSYALIGFASGEHRDAALEFDASTKGLSFDITVHYSPSEKTTLFLANIPKIADADLQSKLEAIAGRPIPEFKPKLAYCFTVFDCLKHASEAKTKFEAASVVEDGSNLKVEFSVDKKKFRTEMDAHIANQYSRTIYIRNLPEKCEDSELKAHYAKFGEIKLVTVPRKSDGTTKKFGFVEFVDESSASKAVKEMPTSDFQGASLEISISKPQQKSRPVRGRGRSWNVPARGAFGGRGRFRGGGGGPAPRNYGDRPDYYRVPAGYGPYGRPRGGPYGAPQQQPRGYGWAPAYRGGPYRGGGGGYGPPRGGAGWQQQRGGPSGPAGYGRPRGGGRGGGQQVMAYDTRTKRMVPLNMDQVREVQSQQQQYGGYNQRGAPRYPAY